MKVRAHSVQIALATALMVAMCLVLGRGPVAAQQAPQGGGSPSVPAEVINQKVEVANQGRAPVKLATLTPQEKSGEAVFYQRCSICHLPPLVGQAQGARLPFGPLLYGIVSTGQMETRARQAIRNGGAQMPGFQYAIQAQDIENIVAYLKSSAMKTPPEWFEKAMTRGMAGGRRAVD